MNEKINNTRAVLEKHLEDLKAERAKAMDRVIEARDRAYALDKIIEAVSAVADVYAAWDEGKKEETVIVKERRTEGVFLNDQMQAIMNAGRLRRGGPPTRVVVSQRVFHALNAEGFVDKDAFRGLWWHGVPLRVTYGTPDTGHQGFVFHWD